MFEITIWDDEGNEYFIELDDYYMFRDFADWADDRDIDYDVEYMAAS